MNYQKLTAIGFLLVVLSVMHAAPAAADTIVVPTQSDWQDQGRVLTGGGSGAWDRYLGDDRNAVQGMASPCAMVKKGGTYYLYYIGADGLRSTDGGMRNRSLGVATSSDGSTFTKHPSNPILEYQPNNNEEEGIYTCGATLTDGGEVALYYQAMDAGSPTSQSVSADGRLALSSDGVHFVDQGEVLDHSDSSVWGYGDELYPVMPFSANDEHYLYYLAKGPTTSWDLGLASGPQMYDLRNTTEVLSPSLSIRGGTGFPILGSDRIYVPTLLLKVYDPWIIEVRSASIADPSSLTTVETVYTFDDLETAMIYRDQDTGKWFLFFVDAAATGVFLKTVSMAEGALFIDGFESGGTADWTSP